MEATELTAAEMVDRARAQWEHTDDRLDLLRQIVSHPAASEVVNQLVQARDFFALGAPLLKEVYERRDELPTTSFDLLVQIFSVCQQVNLESYPAQVYQRAAHPSDHVDGQLPAPAEPPVGVRDPDGIKPAPTPQGTIETADPDAVQAFDALRARLVLLESVSKALVSLWPGFASEASLATETNLYDFVDLRKRVERIQPPLAEAFRDPTVFINVTKILMRVTRSRLEEWQKLATRLVKSETCGIPTENQNWVKGCLRGMTTIAYQVLDCLVAYATCVSPHHVNLDALAGQAGDPVLANGQADFLAAFDARGEMDKTEQPISLRPKSTGVTMVHKDGVEQPRIGKGPENAKTAGNWQDETGTTRSDGQLQLDDIFAKMVAMGGTYDFEFCYSVHAESFRIGNLRVGGIGERSWNHEQHHPHECRTIHGNMTFRRGHSGYFGTSFGAREKLKIEIEGVPPGEAQSVLCRVIKTHMKEKAEGPHFYSDRPRW